MKLKANDLKKELKTYGINTKNLSIRCEYGAIYVTIKTHDISARQIKDIFYKYERIDRCQATGEILLGGNCYVFVSYDWKIGTPESETYKLTTIDASYAI